MINFLRKLGIIPRKPVIRQTILQDDDLVRRRSGTDRIDFTRDSHLYRICFDYLQPGVRNPLVCLDYAGEVRRTELKEFRPYREIRDSFD